MLEHERPKKEYISDRNLHNHYSPEIRFGGQITQKSTIYSLGNSIQSLIWHMNNYENKEGWQDDFVWKKYGSLINACQEKKPANRPSFLEIKNELKIN